MCPSEGLKAVRDFHLYMKKGCLRGSSPTVIKDKTISWVIGIYWQKMKSPPDTCRAGIQGKAVCTSMLDTADSKDCSGGGKRRNGTFTWCSRTACLSSVTSVSQRPRRSRDAILAPSAIQTRLSFAPCKKVHCSGGVNYSLCIP